MFKPAKVECALLEAHNDPSAFNDPDRVAGLFNSALKEESGASSLADAEYWDNHCDKDVLRSLASANNLADWESLRKEDCFHGHDFAMGEDTAAACRAGMYLHHSTAFGTTEVRAAPAGFFAPEFRTCLVRCVTGSYCPQSVKRNHWEQYCTFDDYIEKKQKPAVIDGEEVCPGVRAMHLCPAGSYCPDSTQMYECEKGDARAAA